MEGNCVRKGQNGRKLLRRLKPTVGCNGSKRRRSELYWNYFTNTQQPDKCCNYTQDDRVVHNTSQTVNISAAAGKHKIFHLGARRNISLPNVTVNTDCLR
jgi:hypothetical protein